MASGDDPLADMQNLIGYQGLVGNNPYTPFQSGIPFFGGAGPGVGYINGWPTNAQGQPIQPPPGMTLNQTPQTPAAPPQPALNQGQYALNNSMINAMGQGATGPGAALDNAVNMRAQNNANYNQGGYGPGYWGGPGLQAAVAGTLPPGTLNPNMTSQQALDALNSYGAQAGYPGGAGGAGGAAAGGASAAGPGALNRQQYLQLLANPGPLPTYGAAGPAAGQTATGTPPPNVLQSFLAANTSKNSPYFNTLRGLSQQPGATK